MPLSLSLSLPGNYDHNSTFGYIWEILLSVLNPDAPNNNEDTLVELEISILLPSVQLFNQDWLSTPEMELYSKRWQSPFTRASCGNYQYPTAPLQFGSHSKSSP